MKALKTLALVAASAASLLPVCAHAQTSKPGLWEVTSKMGGSPEMDQAMANLQKQLASMSPAERKQMEAMMGKQGLNLSGPPGAVTAKSCITKEMVDRSQLPVQTRGNCTSTTTEKTSTSMKFKYVCTNPSSTGEGQFNFPNDSSYTMNMKISSADEGNGNGNGNGKPQTNTIDGSGKWLGTDCGNIKPNVTPKAAAAAKP